MGGFKKISPISPPKLHSFWWGIMEWWF